MGSSLLTLVQNACAELGLPRPGQVVGATDDQTVQMYALMNAVGADLLTRKDWTALQTQYILSVPAALVGTGNTTVGDTALSNLSFDTSGPASNPQLYVAQGTNLVAYARLTSATATLPGSCVIDTPATASSTGGSIIISQDSYPVPADFVSFINDTQWDRGNRWQLSGPLSPQEDQYLRSGIVALSPRRRFRQLGRDAPGLRVASVFRLFPPPGQNDTPGPMVYEYLSSYWAQGAVSVSPSGYDFTTKASFTADTDTCIFDDRLMIEGLKWRFFAAKGFDYSSQVTLWEKQVQISMARDGGSPVLSLNRRKMPYLISSANVQDGFFPSRTP
jgi:hypothetical protein